jgi:hypothetical protein
MFILSHIYFAFSPASSSAAPLAQDGSRSQGTVSACGLMRTESPKIFQSFPHPVPAHSSRYAASHACMQSCSVTTALQNSLNAVRWDNSQQHHIPNKYCASSCNVPTLPSSSDAPPFRPEEIGSLISNPFLYCKNFQYPGSISNPDKNVEIASSVLLEGRHFKRRR